MPVSASCQHQGDIVRFTIDDSNLSSEPCRKLHFFDLDIFEQYGEEFLCSSVIASSPTPYVFPFAFELRQDCSKIKCPTCGGSVQKIKKDMRSVTDIFELDNSEEKIQNLPDIIEIPVSVKFENGSYQCKNKCRQPMFKVAPFLPLSESKSEASKCRYTKRLVAFVKNLYKIHMSNDPQETSFKTVSHHLERIYGIEISPSTIEKMITGFPEIKTVDVNNPYNFPDYRLLENKKD